MSSKRFLQPVVVFQVKKLSRKDFGSLLE